MLMGFNYAVIHFEHPASAAQALDRGPFDIDGRLLNLTLH